MKEMRTLRNAFEEVSSIITKLQRENPVDKLTLREKQERFSLMFSGIVLMIYADGNTATHGETYDDDGKGHIANSTHYKKLAGDINLFVNHVWQKTTEAHTRYGEQWERWGGSWGGRFGDGNHYSIKDGGVS